MFQVQALFFFYGPVGPKGTAVSGQVQLKLDDFFFFFCLNTADLSATLAKADNHPVIIAFFLFSGGEYLEFVDTATAHIEPNMKFVFEILRGILPASE